MVPSQLISLSVGVTCPPPQTSHPSLAATQPARHPATHLQTARRQRLCTVTAPCHEVRDAPDGRHPRPSDEVQITYKAVLAPGALRARTASHADALASGCHFGSRRFGPKCALLAPRGIALGSTGLRGEPQRRRRTAEACDG